MTERFGKLYKPGLLLLALVLLVVVSLLQSAMNRQRLDLGFTRTAALGDDAPPVLAFTTVALGSFRGLIANALWMRASQMQDDGNYFEMVQLADWITKLEPHFTQVWLVQGWNMAYNISVKFSDDADRWRWVQSGIRLLRDDGLRYNPREALIYRELAWFFQHKMGQNLDNAHRFYKRAWATNMTEVLGAGMPVDFDALIEPQTDEARARARELSEVYKMDPAIMKEVDQKYGPLEWRLPEPHAIYWAVVGLERSKNDQLVTLRRVIYQSMHQAVTHGRLVQISTNLPPSMAPNLAIVDKANQAYEEMIELETEKKEPIRTAHENFLREVVYLLYSHNRLSDAERYFELLRREYPNEVLARLSLSQYSLDVLGVNAGSLTHDQTQLVIEGFVSQAYVNLAAGEDEQAAGFFLKARDLREMYMKRIEGQEVRIDLPTLAEVRADVLKRMLSPESRLPAELVARLREVTNRPASGDQ